MRDTTIDIVKATAPVLAKTATQITERFYQILFSDYPSVRPFFNQAHQVDGRQQQALAMAIIGYANFIDNPEALTSVLWRVANKHVALNVQPEHYEVVGRVLLCAISDVLGDAATPEILDAWADAYDNLAKLLIDVEEYIYQVNENKDGGWRGARTFEIVGREVESETITSFYLEPADGGPLMPFSPGQYLTVRLHIDGEEVRRNYSISNAPGKNYYRITIKRELGGLVSNHFHDDLQVGSEIDVFPPAGDFVLQKTDRPIVLVTAGVGMTPAISMLDHAIDSGREIVFLHATRNGREHAFRAHVEALAAEHPQLTTAFIYEQPDRTDAPDHGGRLSQELLAHYLPAERDQLELYFLGPKGFMQAVHHYASELGVPEDNMHCEFFGPREELTGYIPESLRGSATAPRLFVVGNAQAA